MSRPCHNCIVSSITLFQIIIRFSEEHTRTNIVKLNDTPTVESLKSIFLQLETIISLVRNLYLHNKK